MEKKLWILLANSDEMELKKLTTVTNKLSNPSLNRLLKLYVASIKSKEAQEPKAAMAYEFAFQSDYSPDKNYLLRNAQRRIVAMLEKIWMQQELEAMPHLGEALLLRRLNRRANLAWVEKESKRYMNNWPEGDFSALLCLPEFIDRLTRESPIHLPAYAKLQQWIDKAIQHYQSALSESAASLEVRRSHAQRVHSMLSGKAMPEHTLEPAKAISIKTSYLLLKAKSFHLHDKHKEQILKEALQLLENETLHDQNFKYQEKAWVLATLALEKYLYHQFDEAANYYQLLFSMTEIGLFERLPESAVNYLSTMLSVERQKEALQKLKPFETQIARSVQAFAKYNCLKAVCHLYDADGRKARRTLNKVPDTAQDQDYFYKKALIILSFAAEHRWDEARRAQKQFMESKTYLRQNRKDIKEMFQLIAFFAKAGFDQQLFINSDKLALLKERCKKQLGAAGAFVHPPKWMLWFTENRIG